MADTGIKELLEAGVHFGHQTRRWDPSMRRYIHGERDGIHIIDLLQTEALLTEARDFCAEIAGRGGKILFVGTKKQARDSIEKWATETGMPFVSRRWLGGLLTNFQTINKRIKRLHELDALEKDDQLALLPTKERMAREAELRKLEFNLGGVRDMQRPPDAVFVIDLNAEEIAVNEARRLDIPIVALVDTNCNPRPVEYVIPGNDDAIRSCDLIVGTLGAAILTSATAFQAAEDARRAREEEEKRKREEEQRKKREEEEARKAELEAVQAEAAAKVAAAGEAAPAARGKAPAQPAQQAQRKPEAPTPGAAKPKSPRKIEEPAEDAKPRSPRKIEEPAEDAKPKSPRKIEDAKPRSPRKIEEPAEDAKPRTPRKIEEPAESASGQAPEPAAADQAPPSEEEPAAAAATSEGGSK